MCNALVCKTLCIYVKKARIRGKIAGRLHPHDSQRLDVIRIFLSVTPYHTSARCFSCSVLTILSYPHSQCQPPPRRTLCHLHNKHITNHENNMRLHKYMIRDYHGGLS